MKQPPAHPVVVVAELDDDLALDLFGYLYRNHPELDVRLARDREALTVTLARDEPAVVVVPVGTDLAAIRLAADCAPGARTIAVGPTPLGERRNAAYCAGADRVIAPLIPVARLAERIVEATERRTVLSGRLEHLPPADLIQTFCLARRTLVFRVRTDAGRGVVWLRGGIIVHAVLESSTGREAMVGILDGTSGEFRADEPLEIPPRSLDGGWETILLTAASEADEQRQSQGPTEDAPTPSTSAGGQDERDRPTPTLVPDWQRRYAELRALGLQSMRAGNLAEAQQHWAAARELQEASADADREDGSPEEVSKADSGVAAS